jgi:hypothetical protein
VRSALRCLSSLRYIMDAGCKHFCRFDREVMHENITMCQRILWPRGSGNTRKNNAVKRYNSKNWRHEDWKSQDRWKNRGNGMTFFDLKERIIVSNQALWTNSNASTF